jgi:hypothetical protein
MVFFIPWRAVAEESGGAHFGFGGAMLLDLPGPALRLLTDVADFHFSDIAVRGDDGARAIGAPGRCSGCWPHDGEVDGGAVEISVLVNLVGGDDGAQAVGANDDRPMLMSASPGRDGGGRAQRATGSSTTIAKFRRH